MSSSVSTRTVLGVLTRYVLPFVAGGLLGTALVLEAPI